METKKLTAKYIHEDPKRLEMALHIFEAMPTVRGYLIDEIFKAIGEQVVKQIDGVELWRDGQKCVFFWTKETGDYWVFAQPWRSNVTRLVAGVYVEDVASIEDGHQGRFEENVDLESWSDLGRSVPSSKTDEHIAAYVSAEHGGGRWDDDDFLRRAIQSRCEVVSVTEVLVRIYNGMFPLASN